MCTETNTKIHGNRTISKDFMKVSEKKIQPGGSETNCEVNKFMQERERERIIFAIVCDYVLPRHFAQCLALMLCK